MNSKHLLLTVFFLIFFYQSTFAQNYRFINGEKKDYFFDINLYSDSSYTLISCYSVPKSTLTMFTILSVGTFSYKNGKYILLENINKYKMAISLVNDTLIVEKGFGWMKDGYFILESKDPDDRFFEIDHTMPKKTEISMLRAKLEKEQKKHSPLVFGAYSRTEHFKINVKEEGKYTISTYDIIFSEGNWERKRNILLLYDNNVNCTFPLFINNDSTLTSISIPTDYMMTTFTLENCP